MDLRAFEAVVRDVLENMPEQFLPFLENVAIVVEEEPDAAEVERLGMDPEEDELLGLYTGVPLLEREAAYVGLPDYVTVYRGPILRICDSADEVRQQIRETVIHEIGHHFGLSDEEMVF